MTDLWKVLSSARACHLLERRAVPFDAVELEFGSGDIHGSHCAGPRGFTVASACWASAPEEGSRPLGRGGLLSSCKLCQVAGGLGMPQHLGLHRVCRPFTASSCLFQHSLTHSDSRAYGRHEAAALLKFLSILEDTRVEKRQGEGRCGRRPSVPLPAPSPRAGQRRPPSSWSPGALERTAEVAAERPGPPAPSQAWEPGRKPEPRQSPPPAPC